MVTSAAVFCYHSGGYGVEIFSTDPELLDSVFKEVSNWIEKAGFRSEKHDRNDILCGFELHNLDGKDAVVARQLWLYFTKKKGS